MTPHVPVEAAMEKENEIMLSFGLVDAQTEDIKIFCTTLANTAFMLRDSLNDPAQPKLSLNDELYLSCISVTKQWIRYGTLSYCHASVTTLFATSAKELYPTEVLISLVDHAFSLQRVHTFMLLSHISEMLTIDTETLSNLDRALYASLYIVYARQLFLIELVCGHDLCLAQAQHANFSLFFCEAFTEVFGAGLAFEYAFDHQKWYGIVAYFALREILTSDNLEALLTRHYALFGEDELIQHFFVSPNSEIRSIAYKLLTQWPSSAIYNCQTLAITYNHNILEYTCHYGMQLVENDVFAVSVQDKYAALVHTFRLITQLTLWRVDALEILTQCCSIFQLASFGLEVLQHIVKRHLNTTSEYVLIIHSPHHYGEYYTAQHPAKYTQLLGELQNEGVLLRIVEPISAIDCYKKCLRITQYYGKPQHIIIVAHGNPKALVFEFDQYVSYPLISPYQLSKFCNIVAENTTIVIDSCEALFFTNIWRGIVSLLPYNTRIIGTNLKESVYRFGFENKQLEAEYLSSQAKKVIQQSTT